MVTFAPLLGVLFFVSLLPFSATAEVKPCVRAFQKFANHNDRPAAFASLLQHLSPADEIRMRALIEKLEAKGVPRETIVKALNDGGGMCSR